MKTISGTINRQAWSTRRKLAVKRNCELMEIDWGHCYRKAAYVQEQRRNAAISRTAKRYNKRSLLEVIKSWF